MSVKDPQKLLIASSLGAVLCAPKTAPFPTSENFEFDRSVWVDLGAIGTQPTVTPSTSTETIDLWNMDPITIEKGTSWTLDAGLAQIDHDVVMVALNSDVHEDGSVSPGAQTWEGQVAMLVIDQHGKISLMHAPNAKITSVGGFGFAKGTNSEIPVTWALNPDVRLHGGKPFVFHGERFRPAPEAPVSE